MRSKLYLSFLILVIGALYLTACDNTTSGSFEDSLDVFTGLEIIPEASNSTMFVSKGDQVGGDSYFQIEIEGIGENTFLQNGTHGGWCLEWKKTIRSNNDEHKDLNWYTSQGSEKWKPLNYLFLIRDELEVSFPDLSIYDLQAAVWVLAGDMGIAPEFNVDRVTASELSADMLQDGVPRYDKETVKAVVEKVMSEFSDPEHEYLLEGVTGTIAETSSDEQDVFVPGEPSDPCEEGTIDPNKVDVMLLFDDTGSFAGFVDDVAALFPSIISTLESTFPDKDFAFGVSRFEDYGGPGTGFSGEVTTGRPFILNQPLVTESVAGSAAARDALISDALSNTAPGFGGDGPETALHALYELAIGEGFDGNGDGLTTGSGDAGSLAAQTSPGTSGDVPAFASNVLPTSGTLGGAGWRTDAQKIVILATDVCTVAPVPASLGLSLTSTIEGQPGTSEPLSRLVCSSVYSSSGSSRYGDISDAKSSAANTVPNATVPSESPSVIETVDALTSFGIQVIGLSTDGAATDATGPSFGGSNVYLSALANLTGANDPSTGDPLVFSITTSASSIAAGIVEAVGTSACDATAASAAKISSFTNSLRLSSAETDTTEDSNYVIFD
ncbi:hypothetical protein [Rhodohalobacter mucosus]|uniref:VWFA domain-containing protein n=1 Tax=Rhodohalobacter mucosus TaxID=2079485 RepID=A0A316TTS3_9BACT|nr:hypothetical protein [Rhodohalobacter mucosus]PWN07840.1 hypothetical protein DDZ15_02175 [Rhodohalobacter mucosus]